MPQIVWGYGHYFLFAVLAAIGAGLALAVAWITDPAHIALPERGVALVVGAAVAVVLLTIAMIEAAAEHRYETRHLLTKVGAAAAAIGAALAAPALTVPGSVLLTGLVLAAAVAHAVLLEHRLHSHAQH